MTDVVIGVPEPVAETLARLTEAVGQVVLVGGWAVQCRLKMARRQIRPTSDVDVILGPEIRPAEKVASDGEDAVRLVEAFGALAVAHDLRHATPAERQELAARLEQIGGSALAAQARVSGYEADPERIRIVVDELLASLRR